MQINWYDGNKLGLIRNLAKELGVKDWKLKEAIDLYFEDDQEEINLESYGDQWNK